VACICVAQEERGGHSLVGSCTVLHLHSHIILSYATRAPLYWTVTLLYATLGKFYRHARVSSHTYLLDIPGRVKRDLRFGASSAPIIEAESKLALHITTVSRHTVLYCSTARYENSDDCQPLVRPSKYPTPTTSTSQLSLVPCQRQAVKVCALRIWATRQTGSRFRMRLYLLSRLVWQFWHLQNQKWHLQKRHL
jgi:hypothetical protein